MAGSANLSWNEFRDGFGKYDELLKRDYIDAPSPVPTGIGPLDAALSGGMRRGLHTLGGEPTAGKSALGLYIAVSASLKGTKVLYVSLEMPRVQCIARCASLLSTSGVRPKFSWSDWDRMGIDAKRKLGEAKRGGDLKGFVDGFMRTDPVALAVMHLGNTCPGLAITDRDDLHSVPSLMETAQRAAGAGLGLIIIDYVQQMDMGGGQSQTEYDRLSAVSKSLNALGNRLSVPVLALSSMNRQSGMRGAPDMHGLRGSGQLEYDSVSSWVLSMPGQREARDPTQRLLYIVKNRYGPSGTDPIRMGFEGAYNNFTF